MSKFVHLTDEPICRAAIGLQGFPGGSSGKELAYRRWRHRRPSFDPWVGKIPWRTAWHPIPVFLPGKSQGSWTEEPGRLGLQRVRHF